MHMPQDANEEFKLYFASFFKMSICVRDFSNKEGVRLGDRLTQFQKNLPKNEVLEATNLYFQGSSNFFSRWCHTWAVVWPMVLGPDPWSLTLGANAVANAVATAGSQRVVSVISCAPCPAAHHRPRAGLRAAWRGMDWSWVQKNLNNLLLSSSCWLIFVGGWLLSCFLYIYIYVFPNIGYLQQSWWSTVPQSVTRVPNLRPWTTTLPITWAGPRVPKFGTAMHGIVAENTLISSSYFGYSLLSEVCRNWWGFLLTH